MAELRPLDWRAFRLAAIAFLAAKLVLLVVARPFMDETYYWLWGQHPALSYFDHPPLIGWTQAVAGLLGCNIFGLRIMVVLTLLGDLALLHAFARHLKGAAWREAFWPTAAIFLATPIFFGLTDLALPDHLLVFFTLAGLYAFTRFRTGYEAGVPRWRFLYLAALAIGLATLSKYTGGLLAIGIFSLVLDVPKLRGLLRSPHFYLASLLVVALQAPVLVWNLQNGMASFGFIFGGRHALEPFSPMGLIGYGLGIVLVLSPFLLWPLGKFLVARDDGHGLSRLVFWISTLGFLVAATLTNILVHWNAIAYVVVLPFLYPWFRARLVVFGHFAFGALIALAITVNYTTLPLLATFTYTDQTSSLSYGWDEVVTEIERIKARRDIGFIATTTYASAGPLAFALKDKDVTSLSPRMEAFDFWFDAAAHAGETAIIVADRKRPLTEAIKADFASTSRVKLITIKRFGYVVERYSIYIARAYAPSSQ